MRSQCQQVYVRRTLVEAASTEEERMAQEEMEVVGMVVARAVKAVAMMWTAVQALTGSRAVIARAARRF